MLRIRPFKESDVDTILTWCTDERAFYKWTAGMLGAYPPARESFAWLGELMRFTAIDEDKVVGFFTMRNPKPTLDELRFGFVILDPEIRGKGYGKAMLKLGIRYAFDIYSADKVSLGVFENNEAAYHCYKAAGLVDVTEEPQETYSVLGEQWKCRELMLEKK